MRLTKGERVKNVALHFQMMDVLLVSREMTGEYLVKKQVPLKKCIEGLVLRRKETGTTEDKPRCGGPRNIRTDASMQRVAASVGDTPRHADKGTMLSAGNDPLLNAIYSLPRMPDTAKELERNITQEINGITPETLSKVMNSTGKGTHCCLTNKGGHPKDTAVHT